MSIVFMDNTDKVELKNDILVSTLVSTADWSVNDETNPAYIKNRPFYEEVSNGTTQVCIFSESIGNIHRGDYYNLPDDFVLEAGQTYVVIFDSVKYEMVSEFLPEFDDMVAIGNGAIINGAFESNGIPFFIATTNKNEKWLNVETTGAHTIEVYSVIDSKESIIVKMPRKFLPDGIENLDYNKKAVVFGDSIAVGMNNGDYSYVDILREKCIFSSITKHAISGTTLGPYTNSEDMDGLCGLSLINKYSDDVVSSDVIILSYMGNDCTAIAKQYVEVGTPKDTSDMVTVCGYTRKVLEKIYELNPTAKILFIGMNNTWEGIDTLMNSIFGGSFENMRMAALQWVSNVMPIIEEYGGTVVYMFEGEGYNKTTMTNLLSSDLVHPNTAGHQRIADAVISRMHQGAKTVNRIVVRLLKESSNWIADHTFYQIYGALMAGIEVVFYFTDDNGISHYARVNSYNSYGIESMALYLSESGQMSIYTTLISADNSVSVYTHTIG